MNRLKTPWLIAGVILVIAMVSMACSFSAGSPNLGQSGQPTLAPTLGVQPAGPNATGTTEVGGNGGAALPTSAADTNTNPTSAVAAPTASGTGQTGNVPQTGGAGAPANAPTSLEQVYDNSNPGTVSILVQVNQGGQSGAGAGSGFIISNDGYIVTNHHVIDGATQIIVRFYNLSDIQAKVVGDDPNVDLAIIKVDKMAEGAHPLPLGDSSQLHVGDQVVAIGNPFALGTSMSSGIISALGRTIPSGFTPYNIPQAIQTDAAINPGNSGGPLINMRGEVIGINAQIQTGSSNSNGNVGIGFAIPINILKQIQSSLISKGSYTWPYLGVSSPADNPLSLNATNTQAQSGALIADVVSGGPSAQAGLRSGDIITQIDGHKINSFDDLLAYITYKHPGDKVQMTVVRGGQTGNVTVTLGERPNNNNQTQQ